jgi:hypothetical protein
MSNPVRWSTTLPAAVGWYWWRKTRGDDPQCFYVYFAGGLFWAYNEWPGDIGDENRVDEIGGEWAGPIPLPEDIA